MELLGCKGQPALNLLGQASLQSNIVGEVLQRDRGLDRHILDALHAWQTFKEGPYSSHSLQAAFARLLMAVE